MLEVLVVQLRDNCKDFIERTFFKRTVDPTYSSSSISAPLAANSEVKRRNYRDTRKTIDPLWDKITSNLFFIQSLFGY